jgi:two-component system response regulator YesN
LYTIVIADDDEILLRGLSENFDWVRLGIEIAATADDGKIALDAVKTFHPDILLTDIRMPHLDGLELISKVKNFDSEIATVIISAHDDFSYAHKAIKQGAEDYILKPINLESLESVMQKIVKDKDLKSHMSRKISSIDRLEDEKRSHDTISMYNQVLSGIPGYPDLLREYKTLLPVEKYKAFSVTIIRTRSENLNQIRQALHKKPVPGIEILSHFGKILILSISESRVTLKENLDQVKKNLLDDFSDLNGSSLFFENGSTVNQFLNLSQSYQEALRVEDLFFIHGPKRDLYLSDFKAESDGYDFRSEAAADKLAQLTMLGNFKAVPQCMDEYGLCIRNCGQKARIVFIFTLSKIFAAIEREALKLSIHTADVMGDSKDLLDKILAAETCSESLDLLKEKLCPLSEFLNLKSDHSLDQLMINAFTFIEENYTNPELRINMVASEVGLSKSYFSIVFKEAAGSSFTDYLTDFRIEKAKTLLSNTNYRSYEISYMVGYNNPTYFSSAFKKQTGMTPSGYIKTVR